MESLQEAVRRNSALLLVTRDTKEDWFLRVKGKVVSARPELIAEAHGHGAQACIVRTETFLHYVRKYLDTSVSDETIRQAALVSSGYSDLAEIRLPTVVVPEIRRHLHMLIRQADDRQERLKSQRELLRQRIAAAPDARAKEMMAELAHVAAEISRLDTQRMSVRAALRVFRPKGVRLAGGHSVFRWNPPPDYATVKRIVRQAIHRMQAAALDARTVNDDSDEVAHPVQDVVLGDDAIISVGAPVIHDVHGVGRARAFEHVSVGDREQALVLVTFVDRDTMVPADELSVYGVGQEEQLNDHHEQSGGQSG